MLESLFNKVVSLQNRRFPVNVAEFLIIPILKNISERVFLEFVSGLILSPSLRNRNSIFYRELKLLQLLDKWRKARESKQRKSFKFSIRVCHVYKKVFLQLLIYSKVVFLPFPEKNEREHMFPWLFFRKLCANTFGVSQRIRVSKNQIKEVVYKWRNGRSSPGMRCLWEISIRSLLGETAQRPLRNLSKKMIFVTSLRRLKYISKKMSILWRL